MIILLPLEPLEERYTKDWSIQFPLELKKLCVQFRVVNGEKLTEKINVGSVLDAYGTNYWKFTQLSSLISHMLNGDIKDDDWLFFADLWYPGIEALQYIKCIKGNGPKIAGILHAGTYDPNDFTYRQGMRPWGHMIEEAWLQVFDIIFVATKYHKDLILRNHNVNEDKIKVTGLPFYSDEFTESRKNIKKISQRIIFPHRMDIEKQPNEFIDLMSVLQSEFPGMTWIMTAKHKITKSEYYDELAKAKIAISFAQQETFGYCMLEATALGCIPLVPDRLSYSELYKPEYKYKSISDLITKLKSLLKGNVDLGMCVELQAREHRLLGESAIGKMIEAINEIS